MSDTENWVIALYRRYVELYGEDIEQDLQVTEPKATAEESWSNPTR